MKSYLNRSVVLAMRIGLMIRNDHIETMFQTGLSIHLLTEDASAVNDPRFASVRVLPPDTTTETMADEIYAELQRTNSECAVTFLEIDITPTGRANQRHGVSWARPASDKIARDKSLQRAHLREAGLPVPLSIPIGDGVDVDAAIERVGTPFVVKPTRGASSAKVELVEDPARARDLLAEIREMAVTGETHFYEDGFPEAWALIEEYLPGQEITVDGVVVDGKFYLGGINTKSFPNPPCFEEDLYVMPFGDLPAETAVRGLMDSLVTTLNLQTTLVNAEMRRDADGNFRFVEFSTRISGGHVYRNVRDVHAVDLVKIFLIAALGDTESAAELASSRHPGRVATCIRFLYRTGVVAENSAGDAAQSPYFREYYPIVERGEKIWSAPLGYEQVALLSVWGPYDPENHPAGIAKVADDVEALLDLDVRPFEDGVSH